MNCKVLDNHVGICHEPISLAFEAIDKQKWAVRKFILRNNTRAALLEGSEGLPGPGDTGHEHASPAGGAGERSGPPQPWYFYPYVNKMMTVFSDCVYYWLLNIRFSIH